MGLFDKLFNKKKTSGQEIVPETYQKSEGELPPVIEKYRALLESTMKESCEITFTLEETKPWESKLGGCPYMEKIEDYPIGRTERPMMFLAQINLEEMPPLQDFPTKGILQFYIEDIDPYGLDEACGIMFGDSGNCTFLISADDLKKRDFSKVEYDWQCC